MARPTFLEPSGELSADDLHCVLLLVGASVPPATIAQWTDMERLVAYDWAMREHLSASDNPVRRRECPHFITSADTGGVP